MMVVPYVCAEFYDPSGNLIHRIRAHELRSIITIPEAVRQDPLFAQLVKDELLKAPDSKLELMALENDPDAKITKNEKPVKNTKTAKAVKAEKTETAAKTEKTGKTEKSATEPAGPENAAAAAEAKADAGQNDTK